jgi:hypothetical protein
VKIGKSDKINNLFSTYGRNVSIVGIVASDATYRIGYTLLIFVSILLTVLCIYYILIGYSKVLLDLLRPNRRISSEP